MKKLVPSAPFIVISLIILVITTTTLLYLKSEDKRLENLNRCEELTLGISYNDVVHTLGQPDDSFPHYITLNSKRINVLALIYYAPSDYTNNITIYIDKSSQKVVFVNCAK